MDFGNRIGPRLGMLDHFHEKQRVAPAPLGLILLYATFEASIAVTRHEVAALKVLQGCVAGLFFTCAVMFRDLSIRVNSEQVTFGFGPFRRTVRLSDISGVRIVGAMPADRSTPGLGVHRTPGNIMTWVARVGPAVEFRVVQKAASNEPAGYVLSTSRPHDLIAALQAGQSSRAVEGPG